MRLRGKGIKTKSGTGDLLVTLDIRMPEAGDEELLEALTRMQADENPRAGMTL